MFWYRWFRTNRRFKDEVGYAGPDFTTLRKLIAVILFTHCWRINDLGTSPLLTSQ